MFCMIHCWAVNKFIKWHLREQEKKSRRQRMYFYHISPSLLTEWREGGVPAALKVKTNAEFPLLKVTSATCSVCLLFPKLSFCSEILCYPPVTFSCMRSTEVWVYCFTTRELILQQLLIYWGHSRSAMWVLWGAFFFWNMVSLVCWNSLIVQRKMYMVGEFHFKVRYISIITYVYTCICTHNWKFSVCHPPVMILVWY